MGGVEWWSDDGGVTNDTEGKVGDGWYYRVRSKYWDGNVDSRFSVMEKVAETSSIYIGEFVIEKESISKESKNMGECSCGFQTKK